MSKKTYLKVYRRHTKEGKRTQRTSEVNSHDEKSRAKLCGEKMAEAVNRSAEPAFVARQQFGLVIRKVYNGEANIAYAEEARTVFLQNIMIRDADHPLAMTNDDRRRLFTCTRKSLDEARAALEENARGKKAEEPEPAERLENISAAVFA